MSIQRRDFLKQSGMLIVSFSTAGTAALSAAGAAGQAGQAALAAGPYPDPDYKKLDSWIVIHENNTATFYVGKTDCGQGTGTAFRQMMADELDIAYDKTTCVMGSTDVTVDQGGSGGSDGIHTIQHSGRSAGCQCSGDHGEIQSGSASHLRRTDRRENIQYRADRK
jgi:CO/xanthine dehydrogenase Mo-binding subunit